MRTKRFALALTTTLALSACNQAATTTAEPEAQTSVASGPMNGTPLLPSATAGPATPLASAAADGVNDGYPDLTPPELTPEGEKGMKGARNFLLSFAHAIELNEFDQAWALLSRGDQQKWSKVAFAKMFADLGPITVAIPEGTSEGAAGSIYYTSPITINAEAKGGHPVRIEGESVLRRVNDVNGATAAQLRWHFDHLTLDRAR